MFSAWPSSSRPQDFPAAIESYRLAAQDVGGLFLPVAGAWLEAWERNPDVLFTRAGVTVTLGAPLAETLQAATLAAVSETPAYFNRR